jgi:hypothetical protein
MPHEITAVDFTDSHLQCEISNAGTLTVEGSSTHREAFA